MIEPRLCTHADGFDKVTHRCGYCGHIQPEMWRNKPERLFTDQEALPEHYIEPELDLCYKALSFIDKYIPHTLLLTIEAMRPEEGAIVLKALRRVPRKYHAEYE